MKRSLFQALGRAVLALGLLFTAPVWAETFAYPDDFPPRVLQSNNDFVDCVAPTGSGAPANKSSDLSLNDITVNSGVLACVLGAYNSADSDSVGFNEVTINGGTITHVQGGYHRAADVGADNNIVTIKGGTIQNIVGGGAGGIHATTARANNNQVIIESGAITGSLVGGSAFAPDSVANNNLVSILGGTLDPTVDLYGGVAEPGAAAVGNTLTLAVSGQTVRQISHFQRINFFLPFALANGGKMLTTTTPTDLTGVTTVNVASYGLGPAGFALGNEYILIENVTGTFTPIVSEISPADPYAGLPYVVLVRNGNLVLRIGLAADLTIIRTVGWDTQEANIGDDVQYKFMVRNHGPNDVVGARVQYIVPVNIEITGWTCTVFGAGVCSVAGGAAGLVDLTVDLPATPPGMGPAVEIEIKGKARASGTFDNIMSVTPPAGITDPDLTNNEARRTVTIHPDAELDVSINMLSALNVNVNAPVSYEIVVTNNGPDHAPGTRIVNNVPDRINNVTWTCAASAGAACPVPPNGAGNNINLLADLPVGETVTITVSGTASRAGNNLLNTATATPPVGVRLVNVPLSSASVTLTIISPFAGGPTASIPVLTPVGLGLLVLMLAGLVGWRRRKV